MGGKPEAVQYAVSEAWRTVFGRRSLRRGLSLAEAGCDSLQFLQFVMVLEQALKRPIALDIIEDDMHPADIAEALVALEIEPSPDDTRPVVFIMPGLDDDELRLARFRRALRRHVRFVLIDYPDWPEMNFSGSGFTNLIDSVTRQVIAVGAGAPVMLSGYSFGGDVAFATACRLVALGCPVQWLGILDSDTAGGARPRSGGAVTRLSRRHQRCRRMRTAAQIRRLDAIERGAAGAWAGVAASQSAVVAAIGAVADAILVRSSDPLDHARARDLGVVERGRCGDAGTGGDAVSRGKPSGHLAGGPWLDGPLSGAVHRASDWRASYDVRSAVSGCTVFALCGGG